MGEVTTRVELAQVRMKLAKVEAERDSLAASLEATKPCEPCQRDDHDNCTGDCSSMCCALAAAERERDSALADLAALREDNAFLTGQWHAAADGLAALRARVEAAVALINRTQTAWKPSVQKSHGSGPGKRATLQDLLAILSPPEGP